HRRGGAVGRDALRELLEAFGAQLFGELTAQLVAVDLRLVIVEHDLLDLAVVLVAEGALEPVGGHEDLPFFGDVGPAAGEDGGDEGQQRGSDSFHRAVIYAAGPRICPRTSGRRR